MIEKLRSNAGETIGETLVALLIAVMAVMIVTGSVVVSARINSKIEDQKTDFQLTDEVVISDSQSVTVGKKNAAGQIVSGTAASVTATVHKTQNGYYYYESNSVEEEEPQP